MGWRSFVKYITNNKAMQYIGRISYGIYLYHMPIPDTIKAVGEHFGKKIVFANNPYTYLSIFFGSVLIIASFSYRFIEKPFLLLKEKWAK
jgi:peptidoglycan/LPS O-acetylase OafA/YrhL